MKDRVLNQRLAVVNSMQDTGFSCQALHNRDLTLSTQLEVRRTSLKGLTSGEARRVWELVARGRAHQVNPAEVRGDPHHVRVYTAVPQVAYKSDILAALARDHP
jgi:hypothetical protein